MCGICGFINLDGTPAAPELIQRMNRALVHRGPDGGGRLIRGPAALAMRRLAIIDLAGGHQPMSNETADIWIVFNGEIYNSPHLRKRLSAAHRFATRSDTETIVHQYEENGADCPSSLRGMFAFALLDLRPATRGEAPTLVLARDRLGIKPLFYYLDQHLLAFASELTSLAQHPHIRREIEVKALHQYLAAGSVAAPWTMFKQVYQLPPGECLVLQGGQASRQPYWQLPGISPDPPPVQEAALALRQHLEEAVGEHLLADVPMGAFLSGGIDSSTVVALMARLRGGRFPTFAIRFEEAGYDESPFSRAVAKRYGTDHHEFTIPNLSFDYDLLQAMVTHHGQPSGDSSALPTFVVSRLARHYVKVVMSGDGGDECFAGYAHYGWARKIDRLYLLHPELRRLAGLGLEKTAGLPGLGHLNGLRRLRNALQASLAPRAEVPLEVLRLNSRTDLELLLQSRWGPNGWRWEEELLGGKAEQPGLDPIARAQRFSFRYYLPDAYLTKVDRMSMANALEVRVPLLDHRLVEFSLSLPGSLHWQGNQGKQVLRRAVADLLPPPVLAHRKQGFSIPLHRWATRAYFDLAEELLQESAVRRRGLFNPGAVRHLLDRAQGRRPAHRSQESAYRLSHRLFLLVVLELWCRSYLDDLVDRPSQTGNWEREVQESHAA